MQFIADYNLYGVVIGLATFLVIGLFHPVVIKAEYYFGTRCWWIFLVAGVVGIAATFFICNVILSAVTGVFAFSALWSIGELFQQQKRVEKGWFPANPNRKK